MFRAPVGFFLMKPGHRGGQVPDKDMRRGVVAGQLIRFRWSDFAPTKSRFDHSVFTAAIAQCRKIGKPYRLLMQTGRDITPRWIDGQWITWGNQTAPAPWSPEMRAALRSAAQELGSKYANDAMCVGVSPTGPTWPSAEMHPMPQLVKARGYSDQAMIEAWVGAIEIWDEAFPDVAKTLAISVQSPMDRLLSKVIAHFPHNRLYLQHNSLQADTNPHAPHHAYILQAQRKGWNVGFEMVCSAFDNPTRFGSSNVMQGVRIGKAAKAEWMDIYPPDGFKLTEF